MTPEEREKRSREWTEAIDRGLREEQSERSYRQDPRTGSSGWKNKRLQITEYGARGRSPCPDD